MYNIIAFSEVKALLVFTGGLSFSLIVIFCTIIRSIRKGSQEVRNSSLL